MATLASPFEINDIGKYILDTKDDPASVQPDRERTEYIVVHHADAIYSPGTACAAIFKAHCNRPDFTNYNRIGYHDVIQLERDGTLALHHVNPPLMQGAGVFDMNHLCHHICAATKFVAIPDDIWIEAIAQACVIALARYPDAKIVGHRDVAVAGHGTACPGQLWGAWKARVLGRIAVIKMQPKVRRFKVLGIPVFQRKELTGAVAKHLRNDEEIVIDQVYANGAGHVAGPGGGPGFIDLDLNALEEI